MGKGGKTFLKKSFSLPSPNPIPPFPKTFVFIESLLPVFPAGRVRTMSFGRFFMGTLGMGSGAKEACGGEEKGGPAGVQAAICLAWLLYDSFGADVMYGEGVAVCPGVEQDRFRGKLRVQGRRRHCVKDRV